MCTAKAPGNLYGGYAALRDERPQRTAELSKRWAGTGWDFQVGPADPAAPAESQRFQNGLFGSPASSVVLDGGPPCTAILDFRTSKDPPQEALFVSLDQVTNATAFDNFCSDPDHPLHWFLHECRGRLVSVEAWQGYDYL